MTFFNNLSKLKAQRILENSRNMVLLLSRLVVCALDKSFGYDLEIFYITYWSFSKADTFLCARDLKLLFDCKSFKS